MASHPQASWSFPALEAGSLGPGSSLTLPVAPVPRAVESAAWGLGGLPGQGAVRGTEGHWRRRPAQVTRVTETYHLLPALLLPGRRDSMRERSAL